MKIGNQIIKGWFEYNDQLEFTKDDVVIWSGLNSVGESLVRLFKVKTNVIGVNPNQDTSEIYYVDYFKQAYGESNILTKSTVLTYLRNIFVGISEQGEFQPEIIDVSDVTNINNSGIWNIADTDRQVVVFKGSPKAYMLISSETYLALRVGTVSQGNITWGSLVDISSNMESVASDYLNRLNALEILMVDKIRESQNIIYLLTNTFNETFSDIFNLSRY